MEKLNELEVLAEAVVNNIRCRSYPIEQFLDAATPEAILAIAEAFRKLEQEKEAAEANHQSCTNDLVEAVLKIDELKLKLAAKDKPKVDCVCCNGHGVVYEDEHSNDGGCAWVPVECPDCLGAGEIEEVK